MDDKIIIYTRHMTERQRKRLENAIEMQIHPVKIKKEKKLSLIKNIRRLWKKK